MSYDWGSSFGEAYASQPDEYEQKMQRDRLQAQLAQETLNARNQIDQQNTMTNFENQLKLMQTGQTNEQSNIEKRAQLDAQLTALKNGYLPKDMANKLATGQSITPEPLGFDGGSTIDDLLMGGVGAYAGNKWIPKGVTANSAQAGLKTAGEFLGKGALGDMAGNGLRAGAGQMANLEKILAGKAGGKVTGAGLQAGTKGALGLAGILEKGVAEKGLGKLLTSLGGKSLGKVGGMALGGPIGLIGGIVLSEVLDKMLNSDDEKERAKAQYMSGMY